MEKKTSLFQQILRFGVVGGGAFVIDYGIMVFLTEVVGINYLLSSAISFTVSVIFNYILSVKWVFNVTGERSQKQDFAVFIVLSIIGLGINSLVMWIGVTKFGINYMITKIGATAIVMVYNFITRKVFLENGK
ncbi:GtrA family protein [Hespellia stercorisuis]|uniref:Putative flippase GtrA (Transmembrane translocase of bactoprenol-linked glucose) n=1 Tax=Hespellia stercorisuis DSM 15480 TaxID=1121950 RepID=A0A1M6K0M9_9FIRM|nr:GtrA family protein [Hespellia stercorisuis]SHJ52444.1 Putative flippase GtrA (transmembrane translocase of bactoprenol-linked glucose) [Hespellia stercorisuis DSM 15480]